jgi:hypothetical protein
MQTNAYFYVLRVIDPCSQTSGLATKDKVPKEKKNSLQELFAGLDNPNRRRMASPGKIFDLVMLAGHRLALLHD